MTFADSAAMPPRPHPLTHPRSALSIAGGFHTLLLGVVLLYLLLVGAVDVRVPRGFQVPLYVLGVFVIQLGLARLRMQPQLTPAWQKRWRYGMGAGLLSLYFSPFYAWWQAHPESLYHLVNAVGLFASLGGLLFGLHQLAAEVARSTGAEELLDSFRHTAITVVLLWGLASAHILWQTVAYGPWLRVPTHAGSTLFGIHPTGAILLAFPTLLTLLTLHRAHRILLDPPESTTAGSAADP